jgi:hypothetical protein
MGLIGRPEMSVTNYQATLRNTLRAEISFTPRRESEITHTYWLFNKGLLDVWAHV